MNGKRLILFGLFITIYLASNESWVWKFGFKEILMRLSLMDNILRNIIFPITIWYVKRVRGWGGGVRVGVEWWGGGVLGCVVAGFKNKNTEELLNLRVIGFSHLNKIHMLQCKGRTFCGSVKLAGHSPFAIRHSMANVKSLTFDVWSYLAIKIQLFIFWRGRGHDGFFRRATLFCAK